MENVNIECLLTEILTDWYYTFKQSIPIDTLLK